MQIDMSLLEGNISASVAFCNVISFKGIASGVLSRGIISVKLVSRNILDLSMSSPIGILILSCDSLLCRAYYSLFQIFHCGE